jgi:type III secretion protein J
MKTRSTPLVVLLSVVLSACNAQIQHGLEERDANELISVLVERGFKAQKVPEKGKKPTWAIEVDDERATDAMRVLTELKLPRAARPTTRSIIANAGLIETPAAERLRQFEGLKGDLESTLETMDGVSSASVALVVPTSPRPGMPVIPSKASVLLRVRPEALDHLTQQRANVRALVAGSVDGLSPDDVVLVLDQVVLQPVIEEPLGKPNNGLRWLVIAMGLALSLVSVVVVVLAWKLRAPKHAPEKQKAPAGETGANKTPASPKPVVNAGVQRKVA